MTAATLTALDAPDVQRAVTDLDYYADTIARLEEPDRSAFAAAVEDAYNAAHTPRALTEPERRVLAFAARHFRAPGAREQAIREQFACSAARYHQVLGALLDRPEALNAEPVLVARLRRQRETRRALRAGRADTTRSAA
jgi:Protein of unknown function (DUF3263)